MRYNDNQIKGIESFIDEMTTHDMLSSKLMFAFTSVLKDKLKTLHKGKPESEETTRRLEHAMITAAKASMVTVDDMRGSGRKTEIVIARRIATWYMASHYSMEPSGIARWLNKSRTLIYSYLDKINDEYEYFQPFKQAMDIFCQKMNIKYEAI